MARRTVTRDAIAMLATLDSNVTVLCAPNNALLKDRLDATALTNASARLVILENCVRSRLVNHHARMVVLALILVYVNVLMASKGLIALKLFASKTAAMENAISIQDNVITVFVLQALKDLLALVKLVPQIVNMELGIVHWARANVILDIGELIVEILLVLAIAAEMVFARQTVSANAIQLMQEPIVVVYHRLDHVKTELLNITAMVHANVWTDSLVPHAKRRTAPIIAQAMVFVKILASVNVMLAGKELLIAQ
jgi:hypothetical protein